MRHVKLPETDKEHVKLLECLHKRFVAGLKMPLEFMQTPQPFNGRDAQASRPVAMHKHRRRRRVRRRNCRGRRRCRCLCVSRDNLNPVKSQPPIALHI